MSKNHSRAVFVKHHDINVDGYYEVELYDDVLMGAYTIGRLLGENADFRKEPYRFAVPRLDMDSGIKRNWLDKVQSWT